MTGHQSFQRIGGRFFYLSEDKLMLTETKAVLLDHLDVRIVHLDPDHPGFRDREYRARRNAIADIAMSYRPGQPIPHAPYTDLEHDVWQTIWNALGPAHRAHA